MKLMIDIPEEVLKTRYYTDYFGCGSHKLTETLDNAIPIPDNATNGDVIKAMFDVEDIWDIQTALNLHSETMGWWHSLYCED